MIRECGRGFGNGYYPSAGLGAWRCWEVDFFYNCLCFVMIRGGIFLDILGSY